MIDENNTVAPEETTTAPMGEEMAPMGETMPEEMAAPAAPAEETETI